MATFALAQDNAFGQPLESQLRSCLLAMWMCDEAGYDLDVRDTVYWVALLRYIGCTGHAHEVATVFGDEIAVRAQTLIHDAANPDEVVGDAIAFVTATAPPEAHADIAASLKEAVIPWATHNFASGCEVGDMLLQRLDFGTDVRAALAHTFERWNGNGFPAHSAGTEIPLPMRVVHVSHDMEAIGRRFSPDQAVETAADRSDRTYDPELADLFARHGLTWFERLDKVDPWTAVLDLEPQPAAHTLSGARLDSALEVAADFIDLKSPFMAGHSRRCADLAAKAAALLGVDAADIDMVRRAALLHEFGTTAVPNSIWDKPGPLTRAERDRMERHTLVTEQMLRRSDAFASLNPAAACHHERCDGSGYHKGLATAHLGVGAEILAAVDVFVGMTTDRADRPAASTDQAVAELRRLATEGCLDPASVEAVVVAAGHRSGTKVRREHPGGLTNREVEVLRLVARGLTTKDLADALFISPKTADHHIQHIYAKTGVSTRAAVALWAMQNGALRPE